MIADYGSMEIQFTTQVFCRHLEAALKRRTVSASGAFAPLHRMSALAHSANAENVQSWVARLDPSDVQFRRVVLHQRELSPAHGAVHRIRQDSGSSYLGDRDSFGDLCRGCQKLGMVVVARVDPLA